VGKLRKHMEELRQELNLMLEDFDACDKERLLKVSRELDEVICRYIRIGNGKG
jgi:septum formation topological specificity factor MinE